MRDVVRQLAARLPVVSGTLAGYDPAHDPDGRLRDTAPDLLELVAGLARRRADRAPAAQDGRCSAVTPGATRSLRSPCPAASVSSSSWVTVSQRPRKVSVRSTRSPSSTS